MVRGCKDMATVVISEGTAGLLDIELIKGDRVLKNMRLMKDEYASLVRQIMEREHLVRRNPSLDEALNMGDGVYRP
jgi:hypothetical protein